MKKFLVGLTVIVITVNSNAQSLNRAILAEGIISYSLGDQSNEFSQNLTFLAKYKSNSMRINPKIGMFVSNSVLIGIGFEYDYQSIEQEFNSNGFLLPPYDQKENKYFVNTYFSKYFQISDKFQFSITSNILFGAGKRTSSGASPSPNGKFETDLVEVRVNLFPGITYIISKRWALTGNMGGINFSKIQETPSSSTVAQELKNNRHNLSLNLGISNFSLGFQYFIRTNSN